MKKLMLLPFLAVALCLAPVATTTGCKTPQQAVVYKTLAAVETSVDAAYKSFLDLVVANKIPMTSVHSVSVDYETFQMSMQAAISVAQGNTNAIASNDVIDAGAKVLNSIASVKGGVR